MPKYNVVLIQPAGNPHAMGLWDICRLLHHSLESLGFSSTLTINTLNDDAINVIVGYHLATDESVFGNCRIIIYQLEQLPDREEWLTPERLSILRRADEIWDYDPENVAFLKSRGMRDVKLLPIGFHERMRTIPQAPKEIDVLFYGSVNERRKVILDRLNSTCRLRAVFGVYGQARDDLIAKSKIILNLHYYEAKILEQARISYLLNNGCFVLSESSLHNPYDGIMVTAEYDRILETCARYLADDAERLRVAEKGMREFSRRPMTEFLREVVQSKSMPPIKATMHQSSFAIMEKFSQRVKREMAGKPIRVLDVGSMGVNGTYKDLFGFENCQYVGLDIAAGPNVDFVPKDAHLWSELPDNSFDIIISGQALEHIEFPWLIFDQVALKLKPDGLACLIAPSRGFERRYPVDCYRYFPDGLRALARWAGLTVLEADVRPQDTGFKDGSDNWGDCHCIVTKTAGAKSMSDNANRQPRPLVAPPQTLHTNNPLNLAKNTAYYGHARPEVVDVLVNAGIKAERVIELGCSAGLTGEKIKSTLGVKHYVGIDSSEDAAIRARAKIDEVHVVDLQKTSPESLGLKENDYDLLVALDVLEHLYDPWEILANWKRLLKPGGHVIVSIPNVQNLTVVAALAEGQWRYEAAGLLDSTHLRFFTKQSIAEMLMGAGFTILGIRGVLNPMPDMSKISDANNTINVGRLSINKLTRAQAEDFFVYQYIAIGRRN